MLVNRSSACSRDDPFTPWKRPASRSNIGGRLKCGQNELQAGLGQRGNVRNDLERRGIDLVIPTKSNRKVQRPISKTTCAMRNRIERFFNKIKHSRRVATRYDKLASSFLGFVQVATIKCWIRFVDTT